MMTFRRFCTLNFSRLRARDTNNSTLSLQDANSHFQASRLANATLWKCVPFRGFPETACAKLSWWWYPGMREIQRNWARNLLLIKIWSQWICTLGIPVSFMKYIESKTSCKKIIKATVFLELSIVTWMPHLLEPGHALHSARHWFVRNTGMTAKLDRVP